MESGAAPTSTGEIGVRHDGGDAETGAGINLGGAFATPPGSLAIEGQVRCLVPWILPPRGTQPTLDDLARQLETVGLADMQCTLVSHSPFPGTDLSWVAYVAAAARTLQRSGIAMLKGVHVVEHSTEPVQDFVASAIAAPKVSRRSAQRLVREAAHEMFISPRDVDVPIWLANTANGTRLGLPCTFHEDAPTRRPADDRAPLRCSSPRREPFRD